MRHMDVEDIGYFPAHTDSEKTTWSDEREVQNTWYFSAIGPNWHNYFCREITGGKLKLRDSDKRKHSCFTHFKLKTVHMVVTKLSTWWAWNPHHNCFVWNIQQSGDILHLWLYLAHLCCRECFNSCLYML